MEAYSKIDPADRFLTIKQTAQKYRIFPEGGIRHLIFMNKDNFRDKVVIKIGKKIVLDTEALLKWITEHHR